MIQVGGLAERTGAQDLQNQQAQPKVHRLFAAASRDFAFSLAAVIAPLADLTAAILAEVLDVTGLQQGVFSVFSETEDAALDVSLVTWPYGGGCGRLQYRGTVGTGAPLPAAKHPVDPSVTATQWYGVDTETTVYTVGPPGLLVLPESALQVADYPVDFLLDLRAAVAACCFVHTADYAKLVTFQPLR